MRIIGLELINFRAFERLPRINFGQINILIGHNNVGKSSILKAIYAIQKGYGDHYRDVRIGDSQATINLLFDRRSGRDPWPLIDGEEGYLRIVINANAERTGGRVDYNVIIASRSYTVDPIEQVMPDNLIVPFLSRRKPSVYAEDVKRSAALAISPDLGNLAAKLAVVTNPDHPQFDYYSSACRDIIGSLVTPVLSDRGQKPGITFDGDKRLYIDQLGDGVVNVVGLLAELATSNGKLFLIEEPENDLHPSALKALLEMVAESAKSNQFVISTHSNIVLTYLGSIPDSRVFNVTRIDNASPPAAKVEEVAKTPQARISVLQSMGYELSDFHLWEGWLIFEESSAERIIREYLIPWFAPKLRKARTISSNGVTKVKGVFDAYRNLVCFAHLEPNYKIRTWIRVDGDESGLAVVRKLRESFPDWDSSRFDNFSKPNFECYYPAEFRDEVERVFQIVDKERQRAEKKSLLLKLIGWLDDDPDRARSALADSAKEVVDFLKGIEANF